LDCTIRDDLDEEHMTLVEVTFYYGLPPGERELQALDRVRQVYGVRKTWFDEKAHTIRVEYDASRLTEHDIAALLRNAGMDIRAELRAAACPRNLRQPRVLNAWLRTDAVEYHVLHDRAKRKNLVRTLACLPKVRPEGRQSAVRQLIHRPVFGM
jgi:hypothetical protein